MGSLCLSLGFVLYWISRAEVILWIHSLGMFDSAVPSLVLGSTPSFLHALAFTLFAVATWHGAALRIALSWFVIDGGYEVAQWIGWIEGTADWWDVIASGLGAYSGVKVWQTLALGDEHVATS